MARKSIDSRMDRIVDTLLPVGSMERREYELPEHLRSALDYHRTGTAQIIGQAENCEIGGAYGSLLAGTLELPTIPPVLRDALQLSDPPTVTEDMSVCGAADLWQSYAQGEQA